MTFRQQMQVNPSKGDETLRIIFQKPMTTIDGYTIKLLPIDTIIKFLDDSNYLTTKIIMKTDREYDWTVPDLLFEKRAILTDFKIAFKYVAIYLDGPAHKRRGVKNRDDKINDLLEKCSIDFWRYPYSGHLTIKDREFVKAKVYGLLKVEEHPK